jgi:enterochelin esterase family protein
MRVWTALVGVGVMAMLPAVAQKKNRPTPPTRDPHTAGYVQATELADGAVPSPTVGGNFILGPTHARAAEMSAMDAPLQGRVVEFTMSSAESKYFPGIAKDDGAMGTVDSARPDVMVGLAVHPQAYVRKVAVYVPKGYVAGTVLPFIVGADGPDRVLFQALDGLIAQGKLLPMAAVSIGNGGGDGMASERGLEYDTMSGKYAEFVEHEVLPRVEAEAKVRLSKDPEKRAVMGGSSGGSCALAMAWYHPEWYHRVLTYSGTYVNQQWPHSDATPHGAFEFAEHLIPAAEKKPLRIWMEVGDRDLLGPNAMRDGMHDWVEANERMAKALAAKGYAYQFVFAKNAGHVDRAVKAQTLAEALEYVWGDNVYVSHNSR